MTSGAAMTGRYKRQAKKTGAREPRSNNDKRRMVTRPGHRARTAYTDSDTQPEFA
jgi:hypothetical protein